MKHKLYTTDETQINQESQQGAPGCSQYIYSLERTEENGHT